MTEDDDGAGGTKKAWGGRFSAEGAPLFERLHASIGFDYVLAPYDIEGSQVHVRMLERMYERRLKGYSDMGYKILDGAARQQDLSL